MLGRRTFMGGVGATAAAVVFGAWRTAVDTVGTIASTKPLATVAAPLDVAGVAAGAKFGACSLQSVVTAEDGAVAVHMRDSRGGLFELEILAHDDRTPGVARAGSLGVYMRNEGKGDTATHEEHGLAAMAFARHLQRRQSAGARMPEPPTMSARSGRTRQLV